MIEKPWEIEYYHELLAAKRQKLLEQAIATEGLSPENELRKKLLEARYGKSLERGRRVDYFIRGWVTFSMLPGTISVRNKKKREKELASVMSDWQFDLANQYGETGKRVLYQEFCNLTLVYIDLCRRDKTYGSVLLGIGRISEDSMVTKIARDIFKVAYEVPKQLEVAEQLRSFTNAATAMVCEKFPEIEEEFLESVAKEQ